MATVIRAASGLVAPTFLGTSVLSARDLKARTAVWSRAPIVACGVGTAVVATSQCAKRSAAEVRTKGRSSICSQGKSKKGDRRLERASKGGRCDSAIVNDDTVVSGQCKESLSPC
jgi:hypothetical protein